MSGNKDYQPPSELEIALVMGTGGVIGYFLGRRYLPSVLGYTQQYSWVAGAAGASAGAFIAGGALVGDFIDQLTGQKLIGVLIPVGFVGVAAVAMLERGAFNRITGGFANSIRGSLGWSPVYS